ncbi:MAG: pyroglutamyl-peptidase I [Spirochaetes bacterium]|nr:pyroglutamyl-peptidase I [Spirochaetota bacterium]MBU1079537.1 pyroglutamyl-peptidase I [Spirochaetota bacterium]
MRVLITGFDPFGGEAANPAFEAVRLLPDVIAGADIAKLELPTVFAACDAMLEEAVERLAPDAVLSVGQAGGRFDVSVERVAINLADGRIPDNAGDQPIDRTIREGGPDAYFATVPVKAMVRRIRAAGVPASVSYSAGSYVCNHLMYCALHYAATRRPGLRAGFIHVPFMPSQAVDKPAATPTMSLECMATAIAAAVEAVVDTVDDLRAPEGRDH